VDVVESKQTEGASSQEIQVRSQERIYDLHHGRFSEPNAKADQIPHRRLLSCPKLSWWNLDFAATRSESRSKGDTRHHVQAVASLSFCCILSLRRTN
jgi:hypothetical protein